MNVDDFRRSFVDGQVPSAAALRRSFSNVLKISVTGKSDDGDAEALKTDNVHTFELLRDAHGFTGRVGFWIELKADEADAWLAATTVDLLVNSPEPDGTTTEILSITGACVTMQSRKGHAAVNPGKKSSELTAAEFWSEFAAGSPVSSILSRDSDDRDPDTIRLAASISFVDEFAFVGKAHFPMDVYTGDSWRNVFVNNGLRLGADTKSDPAWLTPKTIPTTSHICVPLASGEASFYDYVMSVTDSFGASFVYDHAAEEYSIAAQAPETKAIAFNLECDSLVVHYDPGTTATTTVQNLAAVGGIYQQLGESRALQVPRRAVAKRWTDAQTTAVALVEKSRQDWRTSAKESTDFAIRSFPRKAVLPLPATYFTKEDVDYQCRGVAIWIAAMDPIGEGQTDNLWSKTQDRGLRYEGSVSIRSLKKASEEGVDSPTNYLGVPPYVAPVFPVQVEAVVRAGVEVSGWLDKAKEYDSGYGNNYADLFVDDRTYAASAASEGFHIIDPTKTKFRAKAPDADEAEAVYERHWVLSVPTWDVQLRVPHQPSMSGGHQFNTPLAGTTVLVDVYRESAEIARFLSWGPDVEMPDQASGGHVLFGVPGYSNSQLSYRHDGKGEPVLDVARRNKDDYQEITLKEGQLIIKLTTDTDGP